MKKFLELLDCCCDRREALWVVDTHILVRASALLHIFLSSFFKNSSIN